MATEDLEKDTQTNRIDLISTLAMESVFHVFRSLTRKLESVKIGIIIITSKTVY